MLRKIGLILLVVSMLLPASLSHYVRAAGSNNVDVDRVEFTYPHTPSLSNTINEYDVYIPRSSISTYYFAIKTVDENATIQYQMNGDNWKNLGQWTSTGHLPLNPANNLIEIKITSSDGTVTRLINFHVHRPMANDAALKKLETSAGTIAFDANTLNYTVHVPYSTVSTKVTPTLNDADGSLSINGIGGTDGEASSAIQLGVGSTAIPVETISADGSQTRKYTIEVIRSEPSTNATLEQLSLSGSALLQPDFASGRFSYEAVVANSQDSIMVTPTASEENALIAYSANGGSFTSIFSGSASIPLPLEVGLNTIAIRVTAEDRATVNQYVLTVYRQSNDANLSSLSLSAGTLSPLFEAGIYSYSAEVGSNQSAITLTPSAAGTNVSIAVSVNGSSYQSVTSGSASAPLPLEAGLNTIAIRVTAEDRATVNQYVLTVYRQSNDANLSSLSLSSGTLSPLFDAGIYSYSAEVGSNQSAITLTPWAAGTNASIAVSVNGGSYQSLTNSTASAPLPLEAGLNTIAIRVTAEEGNEQIYTVQVLRPSHNATLSDLSLSAGTLTPLFHPETVNYEASVGYSVYAITVKPVAAESHALVSVSVNDSTYVPVASASDSVDLLLSQGNNDIHIKVVSQSGEELLYTIRVNRAFVPYTPPSPTPTTETPVGPVKPISFNDILGSWAEPIIQSAVQQGWISGYPDGTFRPNEKVSRQDFIVMLVKALGWSGPAQGSEPSFSDGEQIAPYAANAIALGYQHGLFIGYPDGSLQPKGGINRQELAVIAMRALGEPEGGALAPETGFADDRLISNWAKYAVKTAKDRGILKGRGKNLFVPAE
ncbi:cadherin-like beta sandwich domain-containing protein [Paenibacillus sp. 2TAB26]|uniref:cadherin-like beta sandwich domain-containing protein n=1 Tax=Paenibacillus sp. 2TAB26 TaxID=3233005 RepID=UPI003F9DBD0A